MSHTIDSAAPKRPWIRDLLVMAAVAIVTLAARSSLADHYVVPSGSMQPTVEVGDRVVVDKAAYGLRLPWSAIWLAPPHAPARGDVVVLASPESGTVLLKRVVAIGGDEVAVRRGMVWIDGRPTREPWLDLGRGGGPDFGPTHVPLGDLLVMGDNRGNSHDGRFFGLVSQRAVLGRAVAVYLRDGSLVWIDLE